MILGSTFDMIMAGNQKPKQAFLSSRTAVFGESWNVVKINAKKSPTNEEVCLGLWIVVLCFVSLGDCMSVQIAADRSR